MAQSEKAPFATDPLATQARRLMELRRLREQFAPAVLFGEPGWDMLVAAFVAAREGRPLNVKALVANAGAPATTAQRWIEHLDRLGLVRRLIDPGDRRRVKVSLTPKGEQAVSGYLRAVDIG